MILINAFIVYLVQVLKILINECWYVSDSSSSCCGQCVEVCVFFPCGHGVGNMCEGLLLHILSMPCP